MIEKKIAAYCLIDCILCNRLVSKLEIIGNNISISNVCKVPFPYLFLRGQGVKIFSLVSDFCSKEGFLIPVLPKADLTVEDSYEGAIVLKPFVGIYFDPIAVADFNSLYPSCIISENLSHDSYVTIGGKYDNLPGIEYVDVEFDLYAWVPIPGKKKKIKQKTGVKVCRYAQLPDGKKSVIPAILMSLLAARSTAKKKMDNETDQFKAKIWNGLQLAYKVTANSVYGQTGADTSPIKKKDIAASTTAVGRRMIMFSKEHVETHYKDVKVTLDLNCAGVWDADAKVMKPTEYVGRTVIVKDSYCVYGDTDSIFIKFNMYEAGDGGASDGGTVAGAKITGIDAIFISMALCKRAAKEISVQLKKPQNLEVEKVICPFMLFSKKRYHGYYYTKMAQADNFYPNSMGIALKRRDNAPIVKKIFGGAIDIIMDDKDIAKAKQFIETECTKMLHGEYPLDEFVISKTLKSYYKKPNQIAHNVLANRQAQRDPGNRFQPNDRVPYAFIVPLQPSKDLLQGDKIETPEYIKQNHLTVNYQMYLTNQIMTPVSQIFDLVPGYEETYKMFDLMIAHYQHEQMGIKRLDQFFKKKETPTDVVKLFDLIEKARITKASLAQQQVVDDDAEDDVNVSAASADECVEDDENGDGDEECYETNYDDPNF